MDRFPVSFVTCVNNSDVYSSHVLKSLDARRKGYDMVTVPNPPSGAKGLNDGIHKALNDLVVCVHQDVIFPEGWPEKLLLELKHIPKWSVVGLAGCNFQGNIVGCVDMGEGWGFDSNYTPIHVQTLDSVCLIVDRRKGIWFDEVFTSFHMYGEDFALQANEKDGAYVIYNPIKHDSKRVNKFGWNEARQQLIRKWRGRRVGVLHTTTGSW